MLNGFRAEHASSLDVVSASGQGRQSAHLILFRGLGGNRPALGVLAVACLDYFRHIVSDT